MPLIAIPLLAGTVGPIAAMSLMAVPTIAINLWQTAQSGYMFGALKRFPAAYPLLIGGVILGLFFLTRLARGALFCLIGVIVFLIALPPMLTFNLAIPPRLERGSRPRCSSVSYLSGGVSSGLGAFRG